jgi:hypothetical protein
MQRAEEPGTYLWEHMGNTKESRYVKGFIVAMLLAIVLSLAYNLQFRMQESVQYFDNFEQIDCGLYTDSIATNEADSSMFSMFSESDEERTLIPGFTRELYQREAFGAWQNFYQPAEGTH